MQQCPWNGLYIPKSGTNVNPFHTFSGLIRIREIHPTYKGAHQKYIHTTQERTRQSHDKKKISIGSAPWSVSVHVCECVPPKKVDWTNTMLFGTTKRAIFRRLSISRITQNVNFWQSFVDHLTPSAAILTHLASNWTFLPSLHVQFDIDIALFELQSLKVGKKIIFGPFWSLAAIFGNFLASHLWGMFLWQNWYPRWGLTS